MAFENEFGDESPPNQRPTLKGSSPSIGSFLRISSSAPITLQARTNC